MNKPASHLQAFLEPAPALLEPVKIAQLTIDCPIQFVAFTLKNMLKNGLYWK